MDCRENNPRFLPSWIPAGNTRCLPLGLLYRHVHGEDNFWVFSLLQGSKLEVPLWLAKGLHDSKRRIISVELPKIYKEAWRTVFSADANVVDLHKIGPYYYGFGSQLLNFDNPENPEIAQTILQASIRTEP